MFVTDNHSQPSLIFEVIAMSRHLEWRLQSVLKNNYEFKSVIRLAVTQWLEARLTTSRSRLRILPHERRKVLLNWSLKLKNERHVAINQVSS